MASLYTTNFCKWSILDRGVVTRGLMSHRQTVQPQTSRVLAADLLQYLTLHNKILKTQQETPELNARSVQDVHDCVHVKRIGNHSMMESASINMEVFDMM